MAFHAHHLRFDKCRAFATAGAIPGLVASVIDLAGVGAVNDHTRDPVPDSAFSQVLDAELHVGGRRVCPKIILDNQHQPEILHGGEVQPFGGHAGGLPPISDVSHYRDVLS